MDKYFLIEKKIIPYAEQTVDFLKKNFLNKEGLLGSAYDADSEGEEGKYYVFKYEEIKGIDDI